MKKRVLISFLIIGVIFCFHTVYAAVEYSFDLQYTGSVLEGVEKDASVMLKGDNGPLYEHVRIKVDVEGPETPKLIAYDSNNNAIDIAQTGYWGPDAGFSIQGTFTNTTPLKATFPKAGKYEITLSLIDVNNANNVIVTQKYTIEVVSEIPDPNTVTNVVNTSNMTNVEELPTTGTTVWEYMMYAIVIVTVLGIGYGIIRKKRQSN